MNALLSKSLKTLIIAAGIFLGPGIVLLVYELLAKLTGFELLTEIDPKTNMLIMAVAALLTGVVTNIFADKLTKFVRGKVSDLEQKISRLTPWNYFSGLIGLLFGLAIAFFLTGPLSMIPSAWLNVPITLIVYLLSVYVCIVTMVKISTKVNFKRFFNPVEKEEEVSPVIPKEKTARYILDTSIIIDGRIGDVYRTGIMAGELVVPSFILRELEKVADSTDPIKRSRGRRGLDILQGMQKDFKVRIIGRDYEDLTTTGEKLVRFAGEEEGILITGDFNLNKIAALQGVRVINLNDLANALKPVTLPGESLCVQVIREGREAAQGLAYLEDGTMIVVENGKKYIGAEVEVEVTSVLQTSAGRMIFARLKGSF